MTLILFIYFVGVFLSACAMDVILGDLEWAPLLLWPVVIVLMVIGGVLELAAIIKENMERYEP